MDVGVAVNPANPRPCEDVLPMEIWTAVFGAYLYRPADFSPHLQWEDVAGLEVALASNTRDFQRTVYTVCRKFYETGYCVVRRYLVCHTSEDISSAIHYISRGPLHSSVAVGAWTRRIDLHIADTYTPASLSSLFRLTPNLRVLVVRNLSLGRGSRLRYRPDSMVQALGRFCPGLQKVLFESVGEEPSVRSLKEILCLLPNLRTLHIDSVHSAGQYDDDDEEPIRTQHSALSSLSIGSVRRQYHTVTGLDRAGVFLAACIPHLAFPNLRVLHLQKGIPHMDLFLDTYGPLLRELGIGSGDRSFTALPAGDDSNSARPHVISYCPRLEHLLLIATEWPTIAPVRPLAGHVAIQEVTVVYLRPENTTGSDRGAVSLALDIVDCTPFPALRKITVASAVATAYEEAGTRWVSNALRIRARGLDLETHLLCADRYH